MLLALALALLAFAALAAVASAEFPYNPGASTTDPDGFRLGHDQPRPNDLGSDFKFQSTPEPTNANPIFEAQNQTIRASPYELHGVRGAHVVDSSDPKSGQAFDKTTGRPDVTIAVLDSGIEWDNSVAMRDLRRKVRLNRGELPVPNHGRADAAALDPVADTVKPCSQYANAYDANGDGVFNVEDYACDTRVEKDGAVRVARGKPRGNGVETAAKDPKPAVLDPQDLLIAFSDGKDSDHNGYVDDIAGWDFLDNDNDPYDDVQYGHGTGEARDSNAEANNGGSSAPARTAWWCRCESATPSSPTRAASGRRSPTAWTTASRSSRRRWARSTTPSSRVRP